MGGKSWTSGTRSASATFNLAAGNTNPQGIADPPAGEGTPVTQESGAGGAAARHAAANPTATAVPVDAAVAVQRFHSLRKSLTGLRGSPQSAAARAAIERSESRLAEMPMASLSTRLATVGNHSAAYDAVFEADAGRDFLLDALLPRLAG